MTTRWGIVGAGKISHDFAAGIQTLPESEHELVAVAASDLSRAQDFAKVHGVTKAYGSYQELAEDANVEVAYIGTIQTTHLELAKIEGLNIEEIIDFIEYSIQLAHFTFGQVKPDWIHALREHKRSDKVITVEVNLRFPDYRQASFYYKSDGVDSGSPGSEIFGTFEKIKLSSFSTPNDIIMTHMGVEIPRNNSELVYMADEVRRCIEHGLIESPKLTNAETLLIAEILTEVYVKILSSWESEGNIMDRYTKTI